MVAQRTQKRGKPALPMSVAYSIARDEAKAESIREEEATKLSKTNSRVELDMALATAGSAGGVQNRAIQTIAKFVPDCVRGLSTEDFDVLKREWRAKLMCARLTVVRQFHENDLAFEEHRKPDTIEVTYDYTLALFEKAAKTWDEDERKADGNARSILSQAFTLASVDMRDGSAKKAPAKAVPKAAEKTAVVKSPPEAQAEAETDVSAKLAEMPTDALVEILCRQKPDKLATIIATATLEYLASDGDCAGLDGLDKQVMEDLQILTKTATEMSVHYRMARQQELKAAA